MPKHICLVAALALASCIATDEPALGSRESALGTCLGPKLHFENFAEATACQKDNAEMVPIALNAIVKAGGTCTQTDRDGLCTSLEPVRDDATARLIGTSIDCTTFWLKQAQHMQCCSDQFGGFDSDRCFSAPYSLVLY